MADLTFQPFSGMSPGQADYARKFGGKLVQQGTSVAPLQHWTQALARALQGGSGALWNDQAAASEKEGQDRIGQIYQAGMSGQVNPAKMAGLLMGQTGGWGQGQGQQVANQVISQRMKAADPMLDLRRKQIEGQLALQKAQLGQLKNQSYDAQVAKRAEIAQRFGIDPNSQEYKNFVLGKEYGGGGSFGKTGAVFRGEDGKYYTIQFGENGQRRILPVDGLAPDRGVTQVGNTLVDKTTGKVRQDVTQNIAGAEQAKVQGREAGKVAANFPKAKAQFAMVQQKWSRVQPSIERARQLIRSNPMVVGLLGTAAARIPGTAAYRLGQYLDTIKANIGFSELQAMRDASPTGGALGQVSEFENRLLQAVQGSLQQGLDAPSLLQNLTDVQANLDQVKRITGDAFKQTYGTMMKGQPPPQTAPTAQQAPQLPPGYSIKRVE